MGYNSGVFSLFNQSITVSNRYADLQAPTFSPPGGILYQSVYAKSIAPTILTTVSGSISSAYAQLITASITVSSQISTAYGLSIAGPFVQAGTVSNAYSLYVLTPSATSGGIVNQVGAFFGLPTVGGNSGGVGIGTSTPMNALDVAGGMAVGVYAGSGGVNSGVLAVSGSLTTTQGVGIGTSNPAYYLDVQGTIQAGSAYGWMPQGGQQKTYLGQSSNAAGLTNPGTNQTICANTTSVFDFATLNSLLSGYNTARFDGRYVYYLPRYNDTLIFFGIIVRYDTTLPFGSSSSYLIYDLHANVNSNCTDLTGAVFDGRYLYISSQYGFGLVQLPFITRYDTTLPFNSTSSYVVFNVGTVYAGATGYNGGIFDGRYAYYTSDYGASSVWISYDTTASFVATQSWKFFDLLNLGLVATNGARVVPGIFDGRYVYLNPQPGSSVSQSFLTRYDTTLPFSVSTSYQSYDLLRLIGNRTCSYLGGVFDGKYYYLSPQRVLSSLFSSQALRYDTTQSFTSSVSYSIYDLQNVNSIAFGMTTTIYDGRYVYYTSETFPSYFGVVITYDTTTPWGLTPSYSVFDFGTVNSLAFPVLPGVYDGTYVYWIPAVYSLSLRTPAYPGYFLSSMSIGSQALNGFTLGGGISFAPTSGSASAGTISIPSRPAGYMMFTGSRGGITKIPYF